MTTFGLIHGAQHGAWSWALLVPELEARGFQAVTMDLPVDDPKAGLEEYTETALAALAGVADDLVVVGHSMAGMVAPIVASRRPTRAIAYLCGVVPVPGKKMADVLIDEPDLERPRIRRNASVLRDDGLRVVSPEVGREIYYHDCSNELAEWASQQLRPTADTAVFDVSPIDRFPDIKTVSIICTEDRVVSPDWSRRIAKSRLGLECIELPGGHAPMLSRPAALADVLATI